MGYMNQCTGVLGCTATQHSHLCPGPLGLQVSHPTAQPQGLSWHTLTDMPRWEGERGVWTIYTMGDHAELVESIYVNPLQAIMDADSIPSAQIFFWRFGTNLQDGLKWWRDMLQDIERR